MAETAALLADEVLPARPLRQWVLALPHALRFLLATNPAALTLVLGTAYRTISGFPLRRAGLTRSTGHTGAVTPARRGMGAAKQPPADPAQPPTPRHVAMNWAKRLKRVFGIEIDTCQRCGGKLVIITSIEAPAVIAKILAHLQRTAPDQSQPGLPLGARAPPVQTSLL